MLRAMGASIRAANTLFAKPHVKSRAARFVPAL